VQQGTDGQPDNRQTGQAFWRSVVDDQASTTVGEELDMTPNAVRKARSRVLKRLREILVNDGERIVERPLPARPAGEAVRPLEGSEVNPFSSFSSTPAGSSGRGRRKDVALTLALLACLTAALPTPPPHFRAGVPLSGRGRPRPAEVL
jgi:hypothetical protein